MELDNTSSNVDTQTKAFTQAAREALDIIEVEILDDRLVAFLK